MILTTINNLTPVDFNSSFAINCTLKNSAKISYNNTPNAINNLFLKVNFLLDNDSIPENATIGPAYTNSDNAIPRMTLPSRVRSMPFLLEVPTLKASDIPFASHVAMVAAKTALMSSDINKVPEKAEKTVIEADVTPIKTPSTFSRSDRQLAMSLFMKIKKNETKIKLKIICSKR